MINGNELKQYIDNFYGFGDWKNKDNPIWYIGIEEGGGKSEKNVQIRLDSWLKFKVARNAFPNLIDNAIHHSVIDKDLFGKGKYQATWSRLKGWRDSSNF